MGKPGTINSGSSLFTTTKTGSGSAGITLWVDLGLIPSGNKIWIGNANYTSVDKVIIFELRTNNTSKQNPLDGDTALLDTVSVRAGTTVNRDLYKSGSLHIVTATGTGVEHWWLKLKSKSATLGSFLYKIAYLVE